MRDRLKASREAQGDRAFVVLVGVMTHQGVPESGMQGEGKQGSNRLKGKGREMRNVLNRVAVVNWRAGYLETRQSGSGKGSWKRANDQSPGTESVVSIALASPFGDKVTRQLPIS